MSAPLRLIAAVLGSEESAARVIAALEAAGYVCVPREPTERMLDAAYWSAYGANAAGVWTDMIRAVDEFTKDQDRPRLCENTQEP